MSIILLININIVAASGSYVSPMDTGSYSISSEFGYRIHPISGELQFHSGIDLSANMGENVYAATSGVAYVGYDDTGGGNYIQVIQPDGDYTIYMHLSELVVYAGDNVSQGQLIGKVGNTGISTGSHLHFGVYQNGNYVNPLTVVNLTSQSTIPENALPCYYHLNASHETGQITLYCAGYFPIKVYKSLDNKTFELKATINTNDYIEYGLTNGTTYWYKIVDYYGREYTRRYTPPFTNININPLTLTFVDDNNAHVKWSEVKEDVHLYLNGTEIFHSTDGSNEFTITGLQPNTIYQVYFTNYEHEFSNTITFTTTNYFNKLEELLIKLFKPNGTDSNSDGIPDNAEGIKSQLDNMRNKLGGQAANDVGDIIDNAVNSNYWNQGDSRLNDIPIIRINYMGINADLFNLNNSDLIPYMKQIRDLVAIFLVVGFIYAVLSLFNIQWKV